MFGRDLPYLWIGPLQRNEHNPFAILNDSGWVDDDLSQSCYLIKASEGSDLLMGSVSPRN